MIVGIFTFITLSLVPLSETGAVIVANGGPRSVTMAVEEHICGPQDEHIKGEDSSFFYCVNFGLVNIYRSNDFSW